jgi:hypothetical protein
MLWPFSNIVKKAGLPTLAYGPEQVARRRFPPRWSVEELDACFVVRDHGGQALIKGTAVLQEYLPIRTHLPTMRNSP